MNCHVYIQRPPCHSDSWTQTFPTSFTCLTCLFCWGLDIILYKRSTFWFSWHLVKYQPGLRYSTSYYFVDELWLNKLKGFVMWPKISHKWLHILQAFQTHISMIMSSAAAYFLWATTSLPSSSSPTHVHSSKNLHLAHLNMCTAPRTSILLT